MNKFEVGDRVTFNNREWGDLFNNQEWVITRDINEKVVVISPTNGNDYDGSIQVPKYSLKTISQNECTSRNRDRDIMTAIKYATDFVKLLNDLHPDAFSYAIKSINKMR